MTNRQKFLIVCSVTIFLIALFIIPVYFAVHSQVMNKLIYDEYDPITKITTKIGITKTFGSPILDTKSENIITENSITRNTEKNTKIITIYANDTFAQKDGQWFEVNYVKEILPIKLNWLMPKNVWADFTSTYSINDGNLGNNAINVCRPAGGTWSLCRNASVAESIGTSYITALAQHYQSGDYYNLARGFLSFDLSVISDIQTITSASISIFGTSKTLDTTYQREYALYLSQHSNPAVIQDFDLLLGATQSSNVIIEDNWSTTGYNAWSLNGVALSTLLDLATVGGRYSVSMIDSVFDKSNVSPTVIQDSVSIAGYSSLRTGFSEDPKIEIEYTVTEPTPTPTPTAPPFSWESTDSIALAQSTNRRISFLVTILTMSLIFGIFDLLRRIFIKK